MRCAHVWIEYYSAIKKDKTIPLVGKCMELETNMLHKISQISPVFLHIMNPGEEGERWHTVGERLSDMKKETLAGWRREKKEWKSLKHISGICQDARTKPFILHTTKY